MKLEYCDGEIHIACGTPAHADLAAGMIRLLGNALEGGPCRVSSSDPRPSPAVRSRNRFAFLFGWRYCQRLNVPLERGIHELGSVRVATFFPGHPASRNAQSNTRMIETQEMAKLVGNDSSEQPRAVPQHSFPCIATDVDIRFDNLRVVMAWKITSVNSRSPEDVTVVALPVERKANDAASVLCRLR